MAYVRRDQDRASVCGCRARMFFCLYLGVCLSSVTGAHIRNDLWAEEMQLSEMMHVNWASLLPPIQHERHAQPLRVHGWIHAIYKQWSFSNFTLSLSLWVFFSLSLRFGKKKEEKSKGETKASTPKQTSELLSEEELERMKEERERWEHLC